MEYETQTYSLNKIAEMVNLNIQVVRMYLSRAEFSNVHRYKIDKTMHYDMTQEDLDKLFKILEPAFKRSKALKKSKEISQKLYGNK